MTVALEAADQVLFTREFGDLLVELVKFCASDGVPFLRERVRRLDHDAGFVESKAGSLSLADHGQTAQRMGVEAALAIAARRRREQADRFIIADGRGPQPGLAGKRGNGHKSSV